MEDECVFQMLKISVIFVDKSAPNAAVVFSAIIIITGWNGVCVFTI
jgi:hypothetical protein